MAKVHKRAPKVEVYVDGRLAPEVRVLHCSLGSDAGSLPEALLEIQPQARKPGRRRLLKTELAKFKQGLVEVVLVSTTGARQVVHAGKALAQAGSLDDSSDAIRILSRLEAHHFGHPLVESFYWDRRTRKAISLTSVPCVFNPENSDGELRPNMSTRRNPRTGAACFIHPDSARTAAARIYHQSTRVLSWTLPEAVFYLCRQLNDAGLIDNPTLAELRAVLPADPSLLRNHECPLGKHLPELLDDLLQPFGYGWTIDFVRRGKRKIRIFSRNDGTPKELRLQPPGSQLDIDKTNLEALSVTADVSSRAFNDLICFGDHERIESTFELVRAWPVAYDDHDVSELTDSHDAWLADPILKDVWRKWVLNEAGDYNKLRPEIVAPFNFNGLFGLGKWVARTRRLLPCLTKNADGSPQGHVAGVYIEWFDSAADAWKPWPTLGSDGSAVQILDRECGIRFDGAETPFEIRSLGSAARVRVTATVASDQRTFVRSQAAKSLLADGKTEVLEIGSRFKYDQRDAGSVFGLLPSVNEDDGPAVAVLAGELLDKANVATIGGTATLTGIDYDYKSIIGQTISGIDGRKVGFNVSPNGRKFPTVVGARIRFDTQQLDIVLDTFRSPIAL
jgi:hypothetical protein